MKLFHKILVANRGEIAIRIMKSARELGIRTAAVYSEVDKESYHISQADEAWCIGESELSDTYLNVGNIIQTALRAKCDAIHPGYGFLAENPLLVKACEKEGITFIGPHSEAIRLMGNKIEARKLVKEIGIPMTKGVTGDLDILLAASKNIPYPLLVKAAAGGGGKGMRIVREETELPEVLESTSREAKSYFGDGSIYVEQFIEKPRHIEIQILGDNHGNVIHLYERECSLQRRYQKIVEESPSITLDNKTREEMGRAAVMIAKEINYNNAGTIEFLLDQQLNFYFLEMNTRIQVEHPVTEMVTGFDLVREQILIAAGNKMSIKQENVQQNGHAIECRIYAEDPENNFLPSPGLILHYKEPAGNNIRIDTGIDKPVEIQGFFDPMISKLIVWGSSREEARIRMLDALEHYVIQGIKTNISYLKTLLSDETYIHNQISTNYCDLSLHNCIQNIQQEKENIALHIPLIAYLIYDMNTALLHHVSQKNIWQQIGYWRDVMQLRVSLDDSEHELQLLFNMNGQFEFITGDKKFCASLKHLEENYLYFQLNEDYYKVYITEDSKGYAYVQTNNYSFKLHRSDKLLIEDVFSGGGAQSGESSNQVTSPMPGKIIKIEVNDGDTIKKGDLLLIVEAMKMENNVVASRDGVIEKVNVKSGNMVDTDTPLILLKELEPANV